MAHPKDKPYDRLFKEILERIIPALLEVTMGFSIKTIKPLKTTFSTVEQREVDFLAEVTYEDEPHYRELLHVEVQVHNDPDMAFRMLEYFVHIYKQHRVPVNQIVLYIGTDTLTMDVTFQVTARVTSQQHRFRILDVAQLSPEQFLASPTPEVLMLAVLTTLEDPPRIIRTVLERLTTVIPEDQLATYIEKLDVLCQLRRLQYVLRTEVREVGIKFNPEETLLFEMGMEKGMEKGLQRGKEEGIKEGLEKGLQRGKEEGIKEGLEKGLQRGKEEGIKEGLRSAILRILHRRLSPSDDDLHELQERLTRITDLETLETLEDVALTSSSLDEFLEALP